MPDEKPDPLPKTTPDITHEQIEQLKRIFPECVTEDGDGPAIDFDLLRATLGEVDALADEDAYTFTWAGKEEAFRAIQTPSGASLAPAPEESVNWDDTRHLFIEGENLEVLKLLYKSYFGRVKMIYIDPPYNTGNDFIYRDDYSEPRRAYLEKTGQMDAEGNVLTSNPETSGRYHSDWLTMMYPRLFLARQLLREDGTLFVSIDDNEVHNLRLLLNEIFGEENFIATVVWEKVYAPKPAAKKFSTSHDYLLVFAKDIGQWDRRLLPRTAEQDERYKNPDDDPRGPWASDNLLRNEHRDNSVYTIVSPTGKEWRPRKGTSWRHPEDEMERLIENDEIWFGTDGNGMPRRKKFLKDVQQGLVPETLWNYDEVGHTQDAKRQIIDLFGYDVFETPKPSSLIEQAARITTAEDDVILDFFAGSCTTAQAVLELNRADGGDRRFIMVQLDEPLPESQSLSDGTVLNTISEIGKERIRRVIAKMQEGDENGQLSLDLHPDEDLGFKVFKLAPSTFRQWEPPEGEEAGALEEQLALFDRGVEEDADPINVIYEVILKLGYSLNARIEPLDVESNRVYRVVDEIDQADETDQTAASFTVCLDDDLADETINALPLDKETTFVCLDTALDDSQKVNLAMGCLLKVI
jgi:adenine-specific DNA-methyltransferase